MTIRLPRGVRWGLPADRDGYVYHGTTIADVERIATHGSLDPKAECRRVWEGQYLRRCEEAIFVSPSPEVALHWASLRMMNLMEERAYVEMGPIEQAVLRIPAQEIPKRCRVEKDPGTDDSWMLKGCRIPVRRIQIASLNLKAHPDEWYWGVP